ncbi:carbohydrate ABC transporter permease [Paenibacillus flagellatus]|uniref:Sugar ABC transporter permease n=1 Tax=Paenibacillus flagellatus TaxID=2211139 RepID=A0A2V5K2V1_9BACL|nr:sugar ABC transporter permease [Paenibacillus flagellatus]PYI52114.1 sugar ABC transporter permease [Paenibacillus flagellatus]
MGGSWMKRQRMTGYLFILPNMLGVVAFFLIPALFSLGLTFTDYRFANPDFRFVGLDNFARMLRDEKVADSIGNTLLYLTAVPVSIVSAFLVALVLNRSVYLKSVLRSMYFMPYITSGVAVGFVWMLLFQPTHGPINEFLRGMGVSDPPGWFASTDTAMYAINFIAVWASLGYNMIIYMAALQEISPELLEAARIDGARRYTLIRRIVWPLVSPTTFLLLITGLIGAIKSFGLIQAITQGGPGTSTTVMSLYIYKTAFSYYEMGYASAVSWMLFAFVLFITLVQWAGQKRWVHY